MKKILFVFLSLFLVSCKSCLNTDSLERQINTAVNEITDAVTRMNSTAEDFQGILEDLQKKLPAEIKEIIGNDLDRLVKTSINTVGAEFRCNADFLRKRLSQGLENLKIKLLNKLHGTNNPLKIFPPSFCNAVPDVVDLNMDNRALRVFGYDFEGAANLRLFAVQFNGVRKDISSSIDKPSDYLLTVNTLPLLKEFEQCKNLEFIYDNNKLYSVAIIPKKPKLCDEKTDNDTPIELDLLPTARCGGDTEFDGNGPDVRCWGNLSISADRKKIMATITYSAKETKSDWSCVQQTYQNQIYAAPAGYYVKEILSPTGYDFRYTDTDHQDDTFGGNGFIKNAVYRGDHGGNDIARYTGVRLYFAPLKVKLVECCNGCVEKTFIQELGERAAAVPELKKSLSEPVLKLIEKVQE